VGQTHAGQWADIARLGLWPQGAAAQAVPARIERIAAIELHLPGLMRRQLAAADGLLQLG
jgi:hypothetical protein